jgi:hypothetical protein
MQWWIYRGAGCIAVGLGQQGCKIKFILFTFTVVPIEVLLKY